VIFCARTVNFVSQTKMRFQVQCTFILLCSLLFVSIRGQNAKDCGNIISDGIRYDLGPIVGQQLTTNDGFSDYKVTLCKDAMSCGGCAAAGFCQSNEFFSDCMGKFAGATGMPDGTVGVILLYDQGDWGNTGQVKLTCNPNANGVINIKGEQFYKVTTGESKHACPAAPGGLGEVSPGTVIMILIVVLACLYLVVGILWNKYREQKEGVEVIPNIDFWASLPGLIKDGVMFTISKVSCAEGGGFSYSKL